MQLGEKDDWTPPRYCLRLADKIEKSGGLLKMDIYKGAYHAFDNPSGTVHERSTSNTNGTRKVHVGRNPEAADQAVARTRAWLAAALKGQAAP
jgi:dienelactone hydrolase